MDIGKILLELRAERERVNAAIAAIEALTGPNTSSKAAHQQPVSVNGGSRMSLAARKRMS